MFMKFVIFYVHVLPGYHIPCIALGLRLSIVVLEMLFILKSILEVEILPFHGFICIHPSQIQ